MAGGGGGEPADRSCHCPRASLAFACPCSAALRSHATACSGPSGASVRPLRNTMPRRYCASASPASAARRYQDWKSIVEGKSVQVRVDIGGRRIVKKKKQQQH